MFPGLCRGICGEINSSIFQIRDALACYMKVLNSPLSHKVGFRGDKVGQHRRWRTILKENQQLQSPRRHHLANNTRNSVFVLFHYKILFYNIFAKIGWL